MNGSRGKTQRAGPLQRTYLLLILLALGVVAELCVASLATAATREQVPSLMDLRTTFSDGAYDPETLVKMAVKKGFRVIFINDHDRMVMEYGLPPFRNIIRKREERNSIEQSGAHTYLQSVASIRKANPDLILIPGAESSPFYFWTGNLFDGSLTANDHERRILTMGLEGPGDYHALPGQHNDFSTIDLRSALPALAAFGGVFLIALHFLFTPGWWRLSGAILALASAGVFVNIVFARPFPFDAYHGKQGAAPYQHFIDTVSQKGGLTFWNYPETRSGVRTLGPIQVRTLPYPEMLLETKNYTGFSALYGDTITITEPGNVWDMTLQQYCRGFRERPPWGIATADFHREGEDGQSLGDYQTVLLLSERSPQAVLEALKGGKMYARQGKFPKVPSLDEFSVSASKPDEAPRVIAGDELLVDHDPRIRITVSGSPEEKGTVRVRLIRSGTLIQTFKGPLPLHIDYTDILEKPGEKIYYRMDMTGQGAIVSNPIFVTFAKK